MQGIKELIKGLSRSVFVVLYILLLVGPLLLIGSMFGFLLADVSKTLGEQLPLPTEIGLQLEQGITEGFVTAKNCFSFLVTSLLTVLVGLGFHSPSAGSLYEAFMDSLKQVVEACWNYVMGGGEWPGIMSPVFNAGMHAGIYCVGLPSFFFGSMNPPVTMEPVYVVAKADPVLLPVQLVVPFENAQIDDDRNLTGQGTSLDVVRKKMLRTTIKTLTQCVPSDRSDGGVTIQPYGFASDDKFQGLPCEESDCLNVQAANRRAKAVYKRLKELVKDKPGLTITEPEPWHDLKAMKHKRNSMIQVPETKRDAFSDRVVVLFLLDTGNCKVSGNTPHAKQEI